MYFCIDMKSFFASVECAVRGLNPLTTPLVVADPERGNGTICLAVSPYLKELGVKNRCRIFEIPKNIKYIEAKPRMRLYIEYATKIHKIFLRYVSSEDIHTYSIDEAFLNIEPYLHLHSSMKELASKILSDIKKELGIVASCGAGDNLFLAKLALDLKAKNQIDNYFYLSQEIFFKDIWYITDLDYIWQIGKGIKKRLNKLGLYSLKDVAYTKKEVLQKEFGVIGLDLYEHAWGIDDTKIADIKAYVPLSKSVSRHQILFRDYSKKEAITPLLEMLYLLCLDLFQKKLMARNVTFYISYSKHTSSYHKTFNLGFFTDDFFTLKSELKKYYVQIKDEPIRVIGISFSDFIDKDLGYNTLFYEENHRYNQLCKTIVDVWQKHGKNKLVLATALLEESTIYERNKQIGGHNSD